MNVKLKVKPCPHLINKDVQLRASQDTHIGGLLAEIFFQSVSVFDVVCITEWSQVNKVILVTRLHRLNEQMTQEDCIKYKKE